MKIVLIGSAHPFRGGGMTSFNERLATELQHQGHDIYILNFTTQYPGFLFPGKTQFTDEPPPAGLKIIRRLHAFNPLNWIGTGRFLQKEKPDLVIIRYWLPLMAPAFGTILRLLRRNRHSKVIAIVDNAIPHEKRPGDKPFTRYFFKACDAFVCMSKQVQNDIRQFRVTQPVIQLEHPLYDSFGDKISKAEARQHLGIGENEKLLLFFGFIRHYKGLDLLLQAMRLVKDKSIKLFVAGEFYEDRESFATLMQPLLQENRLLLKDDFIPNNDIRYYFSAADGLVQPYRSATQSGVTPLAYHFDLPMIVTRVGGLPDYVSDGHTGIVTEPEPAALAEAIDRYFSLGEAHFVPELRLQKQRFSWPAFSTAIVNLYQQL